MIAAVRKLRDASGSYVSIFAHFQTESGGGTLRSEIHPGEVGSGWTFEQWWDGPETVEIRDGRVLPWDGVSAFPPDANP